MKMTLRTTRALLGALCVALLATGCGDTTEDIKDAGEKVQEETRKQRDALAGKIEAELVDFLTCAGVARQSTINQIKATLGSDGELGLTDLLAAPDNVAALVGMAGVTVEGYVLLAQNLRLLFEQGAVKELIATGADGLSCGDAVTLSCTSGTGTTTVGCDPQDRVISITSSYDACILQGKKLQGKMQFTIDTTDRSAVTVGFEDFTIDEDSQVLGEVRIDLDKTSEMSSLAVEASAGLRLESYGGYMSTLSCGQTLTLDRLILDETAGDTGDAGDVGVNFKGAKRTKEDTYALETIGAHLRWSKALDCACPKAGGGLKLAIPRPLGRDGDTATLQVTFADAPAGSTLCGSARVELPDWPTDCSALESVQSDCGKASAKKVLEPLLSAMCQPL